MHGWERRLHRLRWTFSNINDLQTLDTFLPFVAKLDKGRWAYGCHRVSSHGLSTRWFSEKHFMPNDLASPHFSALRAAVKPPLPAP
ncbi:hypothetical protein AB1Y20_018918 [Prymnesium parvum]|uniref:Uncharacterized protein n=1 Tax=Prymnesium parvum TaxID=97485 RepID=A0AB34JSZ7_PRYPA